MHDFRDPRSPDSGPIGAVTLLERLAGFLPDPPGRVLLLAGATPPLAEGLRDRGFTLERPDAGEAAAPGCVAAVVVEEPGSDLAAALAVAHRGLAPAGLLLLWAGADPVGSRGAVRALSEAGFVIKQMREAPAAPTLFVARRDDHRVRAYQPGDEEQILALFERSFHVHRSVARWRWEYAENPFGALRISAAFDAAGKLVAHYAGYPVPFHRETASGSQRLTALQIGDTMTDPAVRHLGRGPTSLLGRTVRHFYATFCEGQVAFNLGVNTGNIQRFSLRFVGARRLEALPYHRLEVAPRRGSGRWLARPRGERVVRVTGFDERWDDLFRRAAPAYGLLVAREARYLEWRYARCPDVEYRIYAAIRRERLLGWGVFRRRDDVLQWGDALFDPEAPEVERLLLEHVLADAPQRGVRVVEAWWTPRPAWWRARAAALGFEPAPEPQDLGFVFVPFALDPETEFRERLYYTMGDSDLF
jgi:hypothetical protein